MSSDSHQLRLERLQRRRLRIFRIEPCRPIRTVKAAERFVLERRIVMVEGQSSLPRLTEAISGRGIGGSWMSDPDAHRIWRILSRMDLEGAGLFRVRLILGKDVLIESTLGPALERIATDSKRERDSRSNLPTIARELLQDVERIGQVRMDRWGVPSQESRPARILLERHLLVTCDRLHTERGYHTAVLIPWSRSTLSVKFHSASEELTLEEAQNQLALAAIRSAVVTPKSESLKWFTFEMPMESLVESGLARRMVVGETAYIY